MYVCVYVCVLVYELHRMHTSARKPVSVCACRCIMLICLSMHSIRKQTHVSVLWPPGAYCKHTNIQVASDRLCVTDTFCSAILVNHPQKDTRTLTGSLLCCHPFHSFSIRFKCSIVRFERARAQIEIQWKPSVLSHFRFNDITNVQLNNH